MEALLEFITHFGWLAVVAVIFAESGLMVGFFLPGDSLLFVSGTLVQQGIFDVNIALFIFCLFLAAVAGNSTGYIIGRKVGRRLFNRPNSRFFRQEYLLEAEVFYEKHGPKTIVLAMFVPIVRAFTPVVAGIADMPYQKFVLFNVLGAAIWTSSLTLIGYFAGDLIHRLGINIEVAVIVIILLSLLPGIIHLLQDPKRRQAVRHRIRSVRRKK
ncbi:MAG TPA: VTT domain-containing protein [Candidatus Saccharibacteria bacterium]|nr:VTT domain-containing protein [Candidatus Saccharibacteria bacterium]HRK94539.1 VTT domain-containing protein [Candidatus Saccharibacteria bacterium]